MNSLFSFSLMLLFCTCLRISMASQYYSSPSTVSISASHIALSLGRQADRWWLKKTSRTRGTEQTCCCQDTVSTNKSLLLSPTPLSWVHRGGGAGAAVTSTALPPKTMSARQMEAFKLFSGGVAGTVAACITNPLEVIKTQLQSSLVSSGALGQNSGHPLFIAQSILQKDGVSGFFRGLPPTLLGIIPSRSAYFYAYQRVQHQLSSYWPAGSPPNALLAGLLAGWCSNTLTNPIWMVRTRMQLLTDAAVGQRAYAGYLDVVSTIWREEGVRGFYKGISASYWGCTEGALQFLLYEQLKTRWLVRQNRQRGAAGLPATQELPKFAYFLSAAAAKMVAAVATYPHEVARTRMREQARLGVFRYTGMWQTLGILAREEGRSGLYAGLGVHLLKVVPNSALMFLTYEVVKNWLGGFTVLEEHAVDEEASALETSIQE